MSNWNWNKGNQDKKSWEKGAWDKDDKQDWKKQRTDAIHDDSQGDSVSSAGPDIGLFAGALIAFAKAMQPVAFPAVAGAPPAAAGGGPAIPPPMYPPVGPPPPAQPADGFLQEGSWPDPPFMTYGPGLQADRRLLHLACIKIMVLGALGLGIRKLRYCWKCFSLSWFSPGKSCSNPACPLYGFKVARQALETAAPGSPDLQALYTCLVTTIGNLLSPACANPLNVSWLDMDTFIWPKLELDSSDAEPDADWATGKGKSKGKNKKGPASPTTSADEDPAPKAKAKAKAKGKLPAKAHPLAKAGLFAKSAGKAAGAPAAKVQPKAVAKPKAPVQAT